MCRFPYRNAVKAGSKAPPSLASGLIFGTEQGESPCLKGVSIMNITELIKKTALRQGLQPRTITTYQQCVERFFCYCKKEPHFITKKYINDYLDYLIGRKATGNTINVYVNALKFFYQQVLHRRLTVNVKYSKVPKRLLSFLEKEEVINLLNQIQNKKHFVMIALLYGAGLRVSELTHLKVQDLELQNNYGWVRQGKGGKDRPFIIAQNLKPMLQEWINTLSPEDYLFTGVHGQYAASSIRRILKLAKKKAGISKNVHPHTLRHFFATHLLENGYAITDVQPLLSHSKIETTLVYTHLARPRLLDIKSPLDTLGEKNI